MYIGWYREANRLPICQWPAIVYLAEKQRVKGVVGGVVEALVMPQRGMG